MIAQLNHNNKVCYLFHNSIRLGFNSNNLLARGSISSPETVFVCFQAFVATTNQVSPILISHSKFDTRDLRVLKRNTWEVRGWKAVQDWVHWSNLSNLGSQGTVNLTSFIGQNQFQKGLMRITFLWLTQRATQDYFCDFLKIPHFLTQNRQIDIFEAECLNIQKLSKFA